MAFSEPGHSLSVPEKPRIIYAGESKDYTLWDKNKRKLRVLYLDQNCSLKEVKRRMETEHQFPVLPRSEYETVLRDHFHFRKKLGRSDWEPIGYRIQKRKSAGKNSQVYLGLKLLAAGSIAKEMRRYKLHDIFSRLREGLSPPLPENVVIRSPSPQPQQKVGTMGFDGTVNIWGPVSANTSTGYATRVPKDFVILDISTMADKHARLEAINAIRFGSPFNEFVTLLHRLMSPTPNTGQSSGLRSRSSNYSILVENTNSSLSTQPPASRIESEVSETLSAPETNVLSDPSQLVFPEGTMLPTSIAQACFAVSNANDWSSTFFKSLFEWVEFSAELSVLRSFFSIESYTVTAIWENLVDCSIQLHHERAFEILIDVASSVGRHQWIMRRSGNILYAAVQWAMSPTVQRLLKLGVPPDTPAFEGDKIKGTPLQIAVKLRQSDLIDILCVYGADVNLQSAQSVFEDHKTWIDPPLIVFFDSGPQDENDNWQIECARILLIKGAQVDVCRDFGGVSPKTEPLDLLVQEWFGKKGPRWCADNAWFQLGSDHNLVHMLSKRSSRAQNHVTVPGITAQARKGLKNLESYLGERRNSLVAQHGTALLEIALSWAAERGDRVALTCLLQFGVDPQVGTISPFLEDVRIQDWHPRERAFRRMHNDLVTILENHGGNTPIPRKKAYSHVESVLHSCDHHRLQSIKLSDSDVETHGEQLLQLYLSHATQRNFHVCASMCDFLWSKNVPKDIKWARGRDSLHFAISQNCCLDMCKFLVGRGYEVHSSPTGHVSEDFPYPSIMLGDAIGNFKTDSQNCQEVVDFLLESGASMDFPPEGPTLLESVLSFNHYASFLLPGIRELIENLMALGASVDVPPGRHGIYTPLSLLCELIRLRADDDLIFRVMDESKDVDQQGDPLAMALRYGRIAVAESLLSRGAKVNHPPHLFFIGVLSTACSPMPSVDVQKDINPHVRLIERLINLGADVNGSAELATGAAVPLHHAAYAGLIEVACLLMKHGADVNAEVMGPVRYMRALDYAAEQGRLDMVQLLRGAGGTSGVAGGTGVDGAIKCAEEKLHYSISDFLRSTIDRSDV